MRTSDDFLLMVLELSGGNISGKTLLQKKLYFLSQFLGVDLSYLPHYYGPYSAEVNGSLSKAKALGFIEEQTNAFGLADPNGFELRRHDYSLTSDGRKMAQHLKQKYPKMFEASERCMKLLASAGDADDYVNLSIAAKILHIVESGEDAAGVKQIKAAAAKLGWEVSEQAIDKAMSFLDRANVENFIGASCAR